MNVGSWPVSVVHCTVAGDRNTDNYSLDVRDASSLKMHSSACYVINTVAART